MHVYKPELEQLNTGGRFLLIFLVQGKLYCHFCELHYDQHLAEHWRRAQGGKLNPASPFRTHLRDSSCHVLLSNRHQPLSFFARIPVEAAEHSCPLCFLNFLSILCHNVPSTDNLQFWGLCARCTNI